MLAKYSSSAPCGAIDHALSPPFPPLTDTRLPAFLPSHRATATEGFWRSTRERSDSRCMQILMRGWTLIVKDAVAARHATQRKHQYAVGARRRSSSIAARRCRSSSPCPRPSLTTKASSVLTRCCDPRRLRYCPRRPTSPEHNHSAPRKEAARQPGASVLLLLQGGGEFRELKRAPGAYFIIFLLVLVNERKREIATTFRAKHAASPLFALFPVKCHATMAAARSIYN